MAKLTKRTVQATAPKSKDFVLWDDGLFEVCLHKPGTINPTPWWP